MACIWWAQLIETEALCVLKIDLLRVEHPVPLSVWLVLLGQVWPGLALVVRHQCHRMDQ